jgi:hypothetical protein
VRQFQRILQTALARAPARPLIPQGSGGFADALRRLRIVPEIGRGYLFIEFSELGFFVGEVKDAPGFERSFPVRRSNVRSSPA